MKRLKRLVLLAGFPGVGKTTISKLIQARTGGSALDLDDFKRAIVDPGVVGSEIDPPEVRWAYYHKALKRAFEILQTTPIVILDEVFHLESLRLRIEEKCREKGVRVIWIEVRCSYDLVKQRLHTHERRGHILGTEECLRMYRLFERAFEPWGSEKENHLVVVNEEEEICLQDVFELLD